MKRLNRSFIKGTNWALAGLLGLFGFTNCNKDSPDEYGAPYGEYSIKGKVLNEKEESVSGIEVAIKPEYDLPDTLYSKGDGTFNYSNDFYSGGTYKIIATDIDGEKNGSYKQDSTTVKFEADDYIEKGKGWYVGKAEKEVTIILKEKEIEEDE